MGWFGKKKEADVVAEPELTIARSRNEIQMRTEANIGLWGLDEASWDADMAAGTIVFHNAKGQKITALMQVIGTYNTEDNSWLWGWDHPSVPEPIGAHARLARDFGARYGLEAYTTRKIECDRDLAWEFTAVACHLAGAQGAYSGPSGPTLVFMTFGTVTISAA
ncbi:hypothetical protein EON77_05795 [bacterium]|nr:MAG: hypothetical protein EON77_05795 [bacterium]